ncbi:MAG: glycosyltransferase [Alphaproteobacteria bacterium]|nr:glycosyltransferase [Alphaproteobacteria bacterium]
MKPKISIVLPTYNGEKWLELSIQSVINQTIKNWELIIVNDCSTDNTLKIANSFAEKDSRITVITNETNKKLPASLNVGFSHARGEYLTWTSDDNLYKKNALEMLSSYLDNHPETSMVSMNEDIINEDGKTVKILDNSYKYKRCAAALMNNCNVGAAFMYRKSIADIVGQYDENTFCAEDYDYWCRIALAGNIDYTSDNIYQYRCNSLSLSATKKQQVKEKTKFIKHKYFEQFAEKYNYTKNDKKLFLLNYDKNLFRQKHFAAWVFISAYKFFVKLIVIPFFWSSALRRKMRKFLSIENKYSFSERK